MTGAPPKRHVAAYWWRAAFFIAAGIVVGLACMPSPPDIAPLIYDKLAHFAAFAALTILALLAFPKARTLTLLMGLAGLGLGIELLQAMPAIDRNPEGMDFLVDVLAIVIILIFEGIVRSCTALFGRERVK